MFNGLCNQVRYTVMPSQAELLQLIPKKQQNILCRPLF